MCYDKCLHFYLFACLLLDERSRNQGANGFGISSYWILGFHFPYAEADLQFCKLSIKQRPCIHRGFYTYIFK